MGRGAGASACVAIALAAAPAAHAQACRALKRALALREKHVFRKPVYYWGCYEPSDFPFTPKAHVPPSRKHGAKPLEVSSGRRGSASTPTVAIAAAAPVASGADGGGAATDASYHLSHGPLPSAAGDRAASPKRTLAMKSPAGTAGVAVPGAPAASPARIMVLRSPGSAAAPADPDAHVPGGLGSTVAAPRRFNSVGGGVTGDGGGGDVQAAVMEAAAAAARPATTAAVPAPSAISPPRAAGIAGPPGSPTTRVPSDGGSVPRSGIHSNVTPGTLPVHEGYTGGAPPSSGSHGALSPLSSSSAVAAAPMASPSPALGLPAPAMAGAAASTGVGPPAIDTTVPGGPSSAAARFVTPTLTGLVATAAAVRTATMSELGTAANDAPRRLRGRGPHHHPHPQQ